MSYNFGEKTKEFSPKHGKDLPVWQNPKYIEAKAKAIEIIESKKYGVLPSDFWILMNATKTEKMAYTGLIISHNGCLKINDCLDSKFDPSCVSLDKEGYKQSLVYTYCNKEQGIYEVGEVNSSNCKNEYPYAMAYKRLFDRVVLKLSKLAYAGIYSDSESDEFAQQLDANDPVKAGQSQPTYPSCEMCGAEIKGTKNEATGETFGPEQFINLSKERFGKCLCVKCYNKEGKRVADEQTKQFAYNNG